MAEIAELETWRLVGIGLMVAAICAFWVLLVLGMGKGYEARWENLPPEWTKDDEKDREI